MEKGKILDEFAKTTGLHRKSVIRILQRPAARGSGKRRGRPPEYGVRVVEMLRVVWEASDRCVRSACKPFVPDLIRIMKRCGERGLSAEVEVEVCHMSAATIDRRLRPWKQRGGRRSLSTTTPGKLLRNSIPIRAFADWHEDHPGFAEVDLVAHCRDSADGLQLGLLRAK